MDRHRREDERMKKYTEGRRREKEMERKTRNEVTEEMQIDAAESVMTSFLQQIHNM